MFSYSRKKSGLILIPARYNSTRFPGKPLARLLGQTALSWTYRRACQNAHQIPVWITSESSLIEEEATRLQARFVKTSETASNGTFRCYEALSQMSAPPSWIINLQGDAVLFPLSGLNALIEACLHHPERGLQSLYLTLKQEALEAFLDPEKINQGRGTSVVLNHMNQALYFSKARLPYLRLIRANLHQHIGMYAYTLKALKDWVSLPPTGLEVVEGLEQLRPLYYGRSIWMLETQAPFSPIPSLDTKEDIPLLEKHLIQLSI
jgi:3-deoxy-manno-octulosonate cytidylyltransferase (CMP-KDO synthetase)